MENSNKKNQKKTNDLQSSEIDKEIKLIEIQIHQKDRWCRQCKIGRKYKNGGCSSKCQCRQRAQICSGRPRQAGPTRPRQAGPTRPRQAGLGKQPNRQTFPMDAHSLRLPKPSPLFSYNSSLVALDPAPVTM